MGEDNAHQVSTQATIDLYRFAKHSELMGGWVHGLLIGYDDFGGGFLDFHGDRITQ